MNTNRAICSTEQWWAAYDAATRAEPDYPWALNNPDFERREAAVQENRRKPVYAFFARFRDGRCLTPAERIELDRLLDDLERKP